MTGEEYGNFLKELRFSYELRMPDPEISKYWFDRVKFIPAESLTWILERIHINNPDRFPKRFAGTMIQSYQEWLTANPNKRQARPECPECDGGWVVVDELDEMYGDIPIQVAYACGRCQGLKRGISKLTFSEAKKQGLKISAEVERSYDFPEFKAIDWDMVGKIAKKEANQLRGEYL